MYSKEDILKANNTSIVDYLEKNGYKLKRKGRNSMCLENHDSLMITVSENKWYWFSRQIGGIGCLDFVTKYEGLPFKEAMKKIVGASGGYSLFDKQYLLKSDTPSVVEFILPTASPHTNKIYDYMCDYRKIDRWIVTQLIEEKKLFQDNRNNLVFVGYDRLGEPKYALKIGSNPSNKFKGEVKGSHKAYAPDIQCNVPTSTVCVFESVIDAMSFITIKGIVKADLIALSGVSDRKLEKYLNDNTNIKQIVFMLDNDDVGIGAMKKLMEKYNHKGYDTKFKLSREKDWNDELINRIK